MDSAILQHHLPIHPEYQHISSDSDCADHYEAHTHHGQSYASSGPVDHLRRDGSNSLHSPASFTFTAGNTTTGPRFVPERGVASESSSYQGSTNFTDSSGGSISTSPSSAASSLAYTNYQQNQCTNVSTYSGAVQLPQTFVHAPYGSGRVPPILDSTGTGMLPPLNPIRSPISSSTHAADREAYASSTSFLARSQLSPASQVGYQSYPDTPRTALSLSGLSLSNPSYASLHGVMASPGYQHSECSNFPWPNLEVHAEMTCHGHAVTPEVLAKVEKGFFRSSVDQKWTCYRRNYFSVHCHFELHPSIANARMELKRTGSTMSEQIQAMGMRLSAAIDGSNGKVVELVQHTPKRDAGPKSKIEIVKVSPTPSPTRGEHSVSPHNIYQVPMGTFHATGQAPGPLLPLQNTNDSSSLSTSHSSSSSTHLPSTYPYASSPSHIPLPGQQTSHTFERVQFKQATANNGKRRASQQYFHLVVELFADVRKEDSDAPVWVKVAHRVSDKIVVRGRSPSHYQNEGQNGQGGRTGSTGGSSGYSSAGGTTYGSLSAGGFRGSSSGYGTGLTTGSYRTNTYGFHPSPDHSGSSASSVDGGAADAELHGDVVMSDADRSDIHGHDGYRYYPATIYEGGSSQGPAHTLLMPKLESTARYSTAPTSWAVKYESNDTLPSAQWGLSGVGRFQGVESSRGFYPDFASNYS